MIRLSAPPISGSMAMAELLKLERLSAGYGEAQVLFDIDLSLAEGRS